MSDKMKFDFEKKVYWSINSIENLHQETAYRIIENDFPINNSIATIEKDPEKGFTCKIFLEDLYDFELRFKMTMLDELEDALDVCQENMKVVEGLIHIRTK